MKITLPTLNKIPIQTIIIAILSVLLLITCNKSHKDKVSNDVVIMAYEAQVKHYSINYNKIGELVNIQRSIVANRNKNLEKQLLKNSELTRLNEQIKIVSETKIKDILAKYTGVVTTGTVTIRYVDSSGTKHDSITDCITVGTTFKDSTKWYQLSGFVAEKGIKIDSVISTDSTTYNLGLKRQLGLKGYFKDWDPTLEVIHSNPNISTISLQNIKLVDKPKWYEKRVVWGGMGVSLGVVLTMLLHK